MENSFDLRERELIQPSLIELLRLYRKILDLVLWNSFELASNSTLLDQKIIYQEIATNAPVFEWCRHKYVLSRNEIEIAKQIRVTRDNM